MNKSFELTVESTAAQFQRYTRHLNLRIKNVSFGQPLIQPNILIGKKPRELFFRT
jgi:hypothetical protein